VPRIACRKCDFLGAGRASHVDGTRSGTHLFAQQCRHD
jgi:hypothetical protein